MTPNWFFRPTPRPEAELDLYCFPHAGVGAAAFRSWAEHLPEWIELAAVQLPGRAWRFREPMYRDLAELAFDVHEAIGTASDRPCALFGHSMGAWVAFEVARRMEASGAAPSALFVSGRRAPRLGNPETPLDGVSDEEFTAEMVRRYGGIPQGILNDPEALGIFLPTLRADVSMLDGYRYEPGPAAGFPIHAYAGSEDRHMKREELELWGQETRSRFTLDFLSGGHFFLDESRVALIGAIVDRLEAKYDEKPLNG